MFLLYVLFGAVAGVVGGMGMGGGTVLIPLLTLLGGVGQRTAQAVNLVAFVPMSLVALVLHFKNGLVNARSSLYAIVPGIVCAVGFALLSDKIDGKVLGRIFGGLLIVIALIQFFANRDKKIDQN